MGLINYISIIAIPFVIFLVVTYGFSEKVKVFDSFLFGCTDGIHTVIKIFPTLIALFLAVSALRNSGILDFLSSILSPILNLLKIPSEIMPLVLVRPISGSASTAVALDIMKTYGVDSIIGFISSTIMGSTETTLYTIAIYTSAVGIKNIRFVLISALIADFVRNVRLCRFLSNYVVRILLTFSEKCRIIVLQHEKQILIQIYNYNMFF